MQLRRFKAKAVSEALLKVKAELGPDAIILSTKNRYGTEKESGRRIKYVEVLAAVDKLAEKEGRKHGERVPGIYQPGSENSSPLEHRLISEIDGLKNEIRRLHESLMKRPDTPPFDNQGRDRQESRRIDSLSKSVASCLGLDRRGEDIISRLLSPQGSDEACSLAQVVLRLRSFISSNIRQGDIAENGKSKCWWAFVGPTGVGKTTTLAKIAARLKFLCKRRGVFICVDGYRMGAVEQLEKYAKLMAIPLEIAKTNKDLVRLFGEYKHMDFIFVDTTGRNPFSSCHKTELERLFDSVPGLMAQVMLSATCKREDLMGAISFYGQFPLSGWTLTKIDETRSMASSIFPLIEAELPLSYVTNGQRVPEDIRYAKGGEIADLALEALKGLGRLLNVPKYQDGFNETLVPETI